MSENQRTVSVREAKAGWHRLLRLVEQGGEVTITRRNRPVVRLVPFEAEPRPCVPESPLIPEEPGSPAAPRP